MNLKYLAITIILLITSSCAGINKIKKKKKQKPLTREEQLKQAALERYRKMRMEQWNNYAKKKEPAPTIVKMKPKKRRKPKPRFIPITKEMQIEVEQRTTWFCMKHRKAEKFSEEDSCKIFINELTHNCEQKSLEVPGTHYVRCVQRDLKL